jgi:hypothetical protein
MNNVAWSEHLANRNARTPEDIPLEFFDPRIGDPVKRLDQRNREGGPCPCFGLAD